ncbi:MAG: hypothetical protein ACRDSP_21120 [Pseudonocardiaceae bacterium]
MIASDLKNVYPPFDAEGFVTEVLREFPKLELKARVACAADNLAIFLPADVEHATEIILAALPPHDDDTFTGSDFGIYTYAPYSDFIARHGCTHNNLDSSLQALNELTKHFTAEDALRYFINTFPQETMEAVMKWSQDSDYHVRRLASEGTRPLLPWSPRVTLPISSTIPVLDNLYSDTFRFVTRSVANHINDITRTDPSLALATLERWLTSHTQQPREMEFLIRNSLRTLIKRGDPRAFEFMGLCAQPVVEVFDLTVAPLHMPIGEALTFDFKIRAGRPERIILDYIVQYPRRTKNGYGEAVFKLKILDLSQGETRTISKTKVLRTTANHALAPGPAQLHIQINGTRVANAGFELLPAEA